jgi:hypothetical protein
MITTKRPTDDMIEVAIVSMQEALTADGETIPEHSEAFEHDPMRLGHATVEPATDSGVSESAVTVPPQPTAASPGEPPGRS